MLHWQVNTLPLAPPGSHVRYMNQGELEVIKQEMGRVSIDILRISESKWIGKGEFNSTVENGSLEEME